MLWWWWKKLRWGRGGWTPLRRHQPSPLSVKRLVVMFCPFQNALVSVSVGSVNIRTWMLWNSLRCLVCSVQTSQHLLLFYCQCYSMGRPHTKAPYLCQHLTYSCSPYILHVLQLVVTKTYYYFHYLFQFSPFHKNEILREL